MTPFPRNPDRPQDAADDTIATLRALSDAATPGPWKRRYGTMSPHSNEVWGVRDDKPQMVLHGGYTLEDDDWSLIVAAVNYVRTALSQGDSHAH